MAERPNALVLKTSVGKLTEGSNPSVSAIVESRDIVPIYGVSRLCRSRASFTQLQIVAILLVGGGALKSRREGISTRCLVRFNRRLNDLWQTERRKPIAKELTVDTVWRSQTLWVKFTGITPAVPLQRQQAWLPLRPSTGRRYSSRNEMPASG